MMRGIILAGGSGTRLYPATLAVNKQLLPIYDKPMIYYPLSVLMLAGIRDILIISSSDYMSNYGQLLGDGSAWGIHISYAVQQRPDGLAQAFTIGRSFVGDDHVALILGDNIFYGSDLTEKLKLASENKVGANVFAYQVSDPERYGVVSFDNNGQPREIEEKTTTPKSNWAVTGLYFFDNQVLDIAAKVQRSPRGEYEITDILRKYLELGSLNIEKLGRGYAWLDTGTHDSLVEASEFVRTVQKRQGIQIACLEEIALNNNYIDINALNTPELKSAKSEYANYINRIIQSKMNNISG